MMKHWSIKLSEWWQTPFSQRGCLFFLFFPILYFLSALYQIIFVLNFWIRPLIKTNDLTYLIGNTLLGGGGKTPFVRFLMKEALSSNKKVRLITKGYSPGRKVFPRLVSPKNFDQVWPFLTDETRETAWFLNHFFPSGSWQIHQTPNWAFEASFDGLTFIESGLYARVKAKTFVLHSKKAPPFVPPLGFFRVGKPLGDPLASYWFAKKPLVGFIENQSLIFPNQRFQEKQAFWVAKCLKGEWSLKPIDLPFHHQRLSVVTGIAHPQRLFDQLSSLGFFVFWTKALRDHGDWIDSLNWPKGDFRLTTFKDWSRWSDQPDFQRLAEEEDLLLIEKTFVVEDQNWSLDMFLKF
jgi:tetraacyldisaccharide-1-P 4'-kinase